MSHCLLLNSSHTPISVLPLSVIGWQHAIKLMMLGRITVLETYPNWLIRSERLTINVPSVAVTRDYFQHKKSIKFSRHNLYLRDLFQCQYCQDTFDYEDLTIDHVVPRSLGGKTSWDNCATSCKSCNFRKGSKPNIAPIRAPYRPDYYTLLAKWKDTEFTVRQESWNQYLGLNKTVVGL
jgi:5-methylcytosine-specific restriction endonuclease McrA